MIYYHYPGTRYGIGGIRMKRMLWLILFLLAVPTLPLLPLAQAAVTYPKAYHTMYLVQTPLPKKPQNYVNLLFVPLGWSKDGKFAYMLSRDPGGAGYEEVGFFRWVIIDLNTDKILWESKRGLEPGLPKSILNSYDQNKAFGWIYPNLLPKYQKYFNQYKIIIQPTLKLQSFPVVYNNVKYYAAIKDVSRVTKYDFPGIIGRYRLVVTKSGKSKTVSQYVNPNQLVLDAQVVGYLKSPYEPRIAIAVGQIHRGWEGPPNPVEIVLSGCRLDKGF